MKSAEEREEFARERRTPHGVRGLKFLGDKPGVASPGRTPHGVRGLKSKSHQLIF